MTDLILGRDRRAGRITLNRPEALNTLTHGMVTSIRDALKDWRDAPDVDLIVIDAKGDRAFCAGGDIATLYSQITTGDLESGRAFWRDEYRMNAELSDYPKPVIALLKGFTMGGGVGLGCHVRHRIVGQSARIAMPECSIGLVPDVGGTLLLSRAPGRLGAYLALTAERMGPGEAIVAGFADLHIAEPDWPALVEDLCETGRLDALTKAAKAAPASRFAAQAAAIDRLFAGDDLAQILTRLAADPTPFAAECAAKLARNAPLAMAATLQLLAMARGDDSLRSALTREYRFSHRSLEQGDFAEGIRARIIEKDNAPRWHHGPNALPNPAEVAAMLAPLGSSDLTWRESA